MNPEVFITCAVTGSADSVGKHPAIPVTPEQIANAAIASAKAGAAIVHCHVRDPESGQGSRDVTLYREVVSRIRDSGVDMVINLTAGMGGDYVLNDDAGLGRPGPGSDLIPPLERLAHVEELLPEICTLDCGSMNFGDGRYVMVNVPDHLRAMARRIQQLGVRPEVEIFDSGHLWFAKQLIKEGLIDAPPMFQLCLGIPWGAPADTATMKTLADALPAGAVWAGFGIGRMQMPMAAQAVLLGGHVRVGLEDNLYLSKGVFADNAQLVTRARAIVENMGAVILGPQQAREKLKLTRRA